MQAFVIPFKTLPLLNRLGMDIEVDVLILEAVQTLQVVICANKNHHRSTIPKNIEHIAFQLNKQLNVNGDKTFSLIEYRNRQAPQWLQWRFNWVGNTPLEGESHELPKNQTLQLKDTILAINQELDLKTA